ncbi:pantoate--beta-alanine ligase [Reichenbachiella agarivorans]|uniref:Pantothenate synthetase n=1 Tax=Reichenbachiella agarivorans TaxID=2979464 RepID=A0ABY6CRH4_9BACT|nr:pantoate--beta-alanine ligase [Reichenbachiella agarivorans]UXP33112.1 pantoate--beta-alanine ligase [Reichenbachiella agarivorans]
MKVIHSILELRSILKTQRLEGKSIGLVATMGALHQGHLSLLTHSVAQNDLTVCSIFVNPIQFNNPEDLKKYPRQEQKDLDMLREGNCDLVFIPSTDEMYEQTTMIQFNFGHLETVLEGEFRPGHFSGVGVVVSKLFNIIQPDRAYFGQKDLQQLAVIKRLTVELNFPVEVIGVPIMRESNGLAMSSRNLRLSDSEKETAAQLYQSMLKTKDLIASGVSFADAIENTKNEIMSLDNLNLEYLEIVASDTMKVLQNAHDTTDVSICAAAYVSGVRIIDNLYLKQKN